MTRDELVSWFHEHRGQNSRKLSMHVSNALMHVCIRIYISSTYQRIPVSERWSDLVLKRTTSRLAVTSADRRI